VDTAKYNYVKEKKMVKEFLLYNTKKEAAVEIGSSM
jgi:hypothetical protein